MRSSCFLKYSQSHALTLQFPSPLGAMNCTPTLENIYLEAQFHCARTQGPTIHKMKYQIFGKTQQSFVETGRLKDFKRLDVQF